MVKTVYPFFPNDICINDKHVCFYVIGIIRIQTKIYSQGTHYHGLHTRAHSISRSIGGQSGPRDHRDDNTPPSPDSTSHPSILEAVFSFTRGQADSRNPSMYLLPPLRCRSRPTTSEDGFDLQEHRPDLENDSPGSCTGSHADPRDPRGQTNLDITNCTHSPELHILVNSFERRFQFYQGPGLI